ncbi:MAG: hypothetical protein DMF72_16185 [Acidobacteria bacterium]|nr:MAG: hypothetical protein DMF72_16185 [Acidobacteriota bacterium]
MMSTMNQSPRCADFSASILGLALAFLLTAAPVAAQSKIVRPTPQPTPKRTHVATLRASDSSEGSRVAISSDQSLNNYEAYRRGDRFYVKIPAADVPRAEAVRGRGFADVKAQRAGDSTVLSFRLQPGATAHVEQRANKLDVVVSVPGGGTPAVAANRSREVSRPVTPATNRNSNPSNRGASSSANRNKSVASKAGSRDGSKGTPRESSAAANKNAGNQKSSTSTSSSNSNSKPTTTPTPANSPSSKASPSVKAASPTPVQKSNIANNASPSPSNTNTTNQSGTDAWSQMKARAHYWLLLAQLNPIPVITGAIVLLAIITLLLFQRRRAKATRRVKVTKTETSKPSVEAASASSVAPAGSAAALPVAEAAVASTEAESAAEAAEVIPAPIVAVPPTTEDDNERRERVTQISAEAKKVFDGEQYDESIVGSNDPETRRLVGAEMLSAMVGRNVERRERAREAFMKHGYFDDATRDLRVAQSDNERAAAARRLSFVQNPEATPHLVGALQDSSPDVRRAAVEALMDVRDPAAIAPLNSLLQNETDRKVPRNLIQQAIDACATGAPGEATPAGVASSFTPESSSQALETEREVIEL